MAAGCGESGHLMLITPERVFYAGLLGRPRGRSSGAFHVYVPLCGHLRLIRDGVMQDGLSMAIVPPYAPHTIESDHPTVLCVTIEPETVARGALEALEARLADTEEAVVARVREAYESFRRGEHAGAPAADAFDQMVLGETLPPRRLDPRIARTVDGLAAFPGMPWRAADCAAEARLSSSRFLHLFKAETGIPFRALRAWKRARALLHFVNDNINFAHLAQDIGYPDSTHFSHSIRRFYGLKPRAIFVGSRDLKIYRGAGEATPSPLGALA